MMTIFFIGVHLFLVLESKTIFSSMHFPNLPCIYVQWDILSNGGLVQEMAHTANGRDPGNCVSLLRVTVSQK